MHGYNSNNIPLPVFKFSPALQCFWPQMYPIYPEQCFFAKKPSKDAGFIPHWYLNRSRNTLVWNIDEKSLVNYTWLQLWEIRVRIFTKT